MQQFRGFLTNVAIAAEDLLREFYRLLYLQFCDSSDQGKNTVGQKFNEKFGRNFYITLSVTIIPTDLVTIWHVSSFFFFFQNKTRIEFPEFWRSSNQKYFCFLFLAGHALLQSHAESSRPL